MTARRGHGEGSVFFDEARGRWVGKLDLGTGPDGRRRRPKVSAKTKAQALSKLRDLRKQADETGAVPNGSVTVAAHLEDWLAKALPARERVRSTNTVDNYTWAVRKHLIPALGHKRLAALTADDVEAMLDAKADAGMAKNTLMRIRSVLAAALKHAERRGKVSRNVADLVDTPDGRRGSRRSLTVDQAEALIAAARGDRLEALYVTGLMLGLRPGELTGLLWVDVDLDGAVLHVRRSLKRERGDLRLGDLKTARSRRSLDMPAPVVDALRRHRAQQAAERLSLGPAWEDTGAVFTTHVGTFIDPPNLRRSFKRLTAVAGIGNWAPVELRHSFVSLMSETGVPLERIADVTGHDGTRMTGQVYRHAVAPSVAFAAAPMEALFGSQFGSQSEPPTPTGTDASH